MNRRTWAPRGQRPTQRGWQRRDRLSVIASLHVSPRGRLGHSFAIHSHNIRAPDVMAYLKTLRRQLGRPLVVVLDRLSAHRTAVRQLLEQGVSWLTAEWLPGYAPDLNPVEALWSHSKYSTLANFLPDDVDELFDHVAEAVDSVHADQHLLASFFQAAKLPLKP